VDDLVGSSMFVHRSSNFNFKMQKVSKNTNFYLRRIKRARKG